MLLQGNVFVHRDRNERKTKNIFMFEYAEEDLFSFSDVFIFLFTLSDVFYFFHGYYCCSEKKRNS